MDRDEEEFALKKSISNRKDALFEELLNLLMDQAKLYDNFKMALEDEKKQIVGLDLAGLAETGRLKEALLRKIDRLEKDRLTLMADLSEVFEVSLKDLTVGKLLAHAHGYYESRIRSSREALLTLAEQVKELNHLNQLLVKHTLELITSSYSYLGQLAAPHSVYQNSGGLRVRQQSGRFISNNI